MAHVKYEINFMDYLHEKAQESRNKETQACLMFIVGIVFFIGGILETLMLTGNPEWFIFIPYYTEPLLGAILGLSLIISGLSLMVYGIFAGLIIRVRRRQFMEDLRNVSSAEGRKLMRKKQKKTQGINKNKKQGRAYIPMDEETQKLLQQRAKQAGVTVDEYATELTKKFLEAMKKNPKAVMQLLGRVE